jgi:two-component system sensor histidine kinase CreC
MRFRWPKIPLGLRFFIVYFILVLMTAYLVSSTLIKEIKPAIRQATEETLVDMANLLAVMASHEVDQNGPLSQDFSNRLLEFGKRQPQADIWGVNKKSVNHRIYITNVTGIVIADSWQQDIGADFSKWNDVYLTLRGQYGARSTALDKNDPLSTVMHVAAPIYKDQTIIGSVTVAKANRSVQPFIEQSKKRVINWLILISLFALSLGALFAWRINSAVNKLTVFAEKNRCW